MKAEVGSQLMGDLPASRLGSTRVFLEVGIDYAGPITLRESLLRGSQKVKGYVAVFICLATKAVHLELVNSLTSMGFIGALKRFISRRGRPTDIFSDNGTTFHGADEELKQMLQQVWNQEEEIINQMTEDEITWHFIPAGAPHHGGLWEAAVKSMKHHLRRVMGNAVLNYEELSTLLCQIEGCLNSRPLCQMSSDPNDLMALTPGHFLIGDSITAISEPNLEGIQLNRLNRWQLQQRIMQHFWRRWRMEYLSSLQQRDKKWTKEKSNLEVGDLVLIKEDNISPLKWIMGRVQEIHPGSDGLVRVASIKTSSNIIKRPVVKLCKLPIND